MDIHFLKISLALYETGFFDEIFDQILHQMTAAIFAPVGVKPRFDARRIVHKIVDDVVRQQIKKAGMLHEIGIAFIRNGQAGQARTAVKSIQIAAVFVLAIDFTGTDRKQQRNAFQNFRIFPE